MRAVLSQVVPFELGEVIGMPRVNGCRYRIRVAPLTMTLWTDDVVSLVSVSGGYQALCCRYGQVCGLGIFKRKRREVVLYAHSRAVHFHMPQWIEVHGVSSQMAAVVTCGSNLGQQLILLSYIVLAITSHLCRLRITYRSY